MNNTINYKRIFNNIWNTQILTLTYKLSIYYKNGLMFKYSPFVIENKNYSDKREVKK